MSIQLTIEQLVLDGLSLSTLQGVALKLSIETELEQLLRVRGLEGLTGGAVPRLTVDSLQLAAGGRQHEWGRQIARNLYAGLAVTSSVPRPENNFNSNFSARGDAQATAASLHQNTKSPTLPK